HVGDIKIFAPIAIEITPSGTHPGPNILDTCLSSDIGEGAVAVVAIKILSPEIVSNEQVWPAVVVIVAPGAGKAVTIIVLIEASLLGDVLKSTISAIAVPDIWRPVPSIVVRTRYLSGCYRPAIGADVQVQETIMIIIGQGCRGHGPLSGTVCRE